MGKARVLDKCIILSLSQSFHISFLAHFMCQTVLMPGVNQTKTTKVPIFMKFIF